MNTTTNMDVANTILSQINAGDRWARARWGVKQMIADGETLRLHCSGPFRSLKVFVTLDASDTYTVTIYRVRGVNVKELSSLSFVYADSLIAVIEAALVAAVTK